MNTNFYMFSFKVAEQVPEIKGVFSLRGKNEGWLFDTNKLNMLAKWSNLMPMKLYWNHCMWQTYQSLSLMIIQPFQYLWRGPVGDRKGQSATVWFVYIVYCSPCNLILTKQNHWILHISRGKCQRKLKVW